MRMIRVCNKAGLETLRALDADEAYASAGALTYMAQSSAYFGDPELALRQMSGAIAQQPSSQAVRTGPLR